jgi:hypothetical protein
MDSGFLLRGLREALVSVGREAKITPDFTVDFTVAVSG